MKRLTSLPAADTSVLECRSMGHAWTHSHDESVTLAGDRLLTTTRVETCLRCRSWRTRDLVFLSSGTDFSAHVRMHYTDGYLAARGVHFTRGEALTELYIRTVLIDRRQS